MPSDHGSGCNLGCDVQGPLGHGQVWSEQIGMASGGLGENDGVNLEKVG